MESSDDDHVPEYLAIQTTRMVQNLVRVDGLIDLHDYLEQLIRQATNRPPDIDDVLRSAVVLLHASLEDFLRSVALKHLPRTRASDLGEIPLSGAGRATKFAISDLLAHRGKQVDAVIDESLDEWLHQQTFNSCGDIAAILRRFGVPTECVNETFPVLEEMIARRHVIVHNADRPKIASGNEPTDASAIDRWTVKKWREAVQHFMNKVLYKLQFVAESKPIAAQ